MTRLAFICSAIRWAAAALLCAERHAVRCLGGRCAHGGGHSAMLTASELKPMLEWLLQRRRTTPPDFDAAVKKLSKRGHRSGWTPQSGAIGSYQRGPWLGPYKSN